MRGPSSSHSAASVRIGRLLRDLCGGTPQRVRFDFDTLGSLPTTHDTQGSDMGLFGGLLGLEPDDARLPESAALLRAAGCEVEFCFAELRDPHPNTYRLTATRDGVTHRMVAVSTGGGMIEVIELDGAEVSLFGDYDVTLLDVEGGAADVAAQLVPHVDDVQVAGSMVVAMGQRFVADEVLAALPAVRRVRRLAAVLPVRSRRGLTVPFLHAGELAAYGDLDALPLSHFALAYETARGGIDEAAVLQRMRHVRKIGREGVAAGLAGTDYPGRVLPRQSHLFAARMAAGTLLESGLLNKAILAVTALMEVKSSMGVFVAAPTAGSCGTWAGTCHAAIEQLGCETSGDAKAEQRALRAMLAGGLIGVFVATRSSFAAEVGGCQAETGAGAAMAAASLVELAGGSAAQSLSAASHAIQNVLGLICDPVANRVEAPCLGRNIAGAANAIACANMALSGYDHLVPLDEVLDAHREVSESMARELRCTALGGLSITPTSKAIEARLAKECGSGGCGSCG
ncbi:MAG: L-serine ammonia-lyase, iron-sulfur-dependent, subunit alpha [Planctomycetes bacterium]|nr:L-serine ammonia-lyase, iron-sulfur-dependent, subunit alpha [Planctomycetota bacterium]